MRLAVSRFSFSIVLPGTDVAFQRIFADALREMVDGDDRYAVYSDESGHIVVAVSPRFDDTVTYENLAEMSEHYAEQVRELIGKAYNLAEQRYTLYQHLERIDSALSGKDVLDGVVPSVW